MKRLTNPLFMLLRSLRQWVCRAPNVAALFLLRTYQLMLSPLLGGRCRFYPSCSVYSAECFHNLPFHQACAHSARRLLSCHPLGRSGYDPAPVRRSDV